VKQKDNTRLTGRPAISVVVTTHQRADLLARCLAALLAQEAAPPYEIVVVDDGSRDGTRDLAALLDPRVRYHWQENAGRAAARNKGLELAEGPLLVYVDSDVFVVPGFLAAHAAAHRRAGGRLVFAQGVSVDVTRPVDPAAPGVPVADPSRAFFDTKNVSVPTDLLRRAGGFDARFTQYGWEDLEAGMRLRDLGVRKVRAAGAVGFHYHPAFAPGDLEKLARLEEERGRMGARFLALRPTWEVRLMIGLTPLHHFVFWLMTGGWRRPDGASPRLVSFLAERPALAALALPGLLAPRGYTALRQELAAMSAENLTGI